MSRLRVGGMKPPSIPAMMAAMPAEPLAPCEWPICDLVELVGVFKR